MKKRLSPHTLYLLVVGMVFLAFAFVFLFMPRSTYSELEKRDLAEFPDIKMINENPSRFTSEISQWFSDSEPYRDIFMTVSMKIRDFFRYKPGNDEEAVTFRPMAETTVKENIEDEETTADKEMEPGVNPLAEENAKLAGSGIIIVGSGDHVRALMAYGGSSKSGDAYINTVNEYAETFPEVSVYALVAPLATEFYLPDKAKRSSNPQLPTINHIREGLSQKVKFVDAYSALSAHTLEDIYLRTDHHWAPLGAYYAAAELAKTAKVDFPGLDKYDKKVVHNFVGSMYGYSKDISVKNSPEDFIYHIPKNLDFKTTFITYFLNKDYKITSESKPFEGKFFKSFKDGSGAAYSTFMGGDQTLVKVETGTGSPRKLLIIKDSYGNALPGYLFFSFGEVHVVDFRYFTKNMKQYVADNGITDIVLAFNIFNVCSSGNMKKVKTFLTQRNGEYAPKNPEGKEKKNQDENLKISDEKILQTETGVKSSDLTQGSMEKSNEIVETSKAENKERNEETSQTSPSVKEEI